MKVSIAKNRMDTHLKVIDVIKSEFSKIFLKCTKTYETQEEYKNLDKKTKDEIKDVGGFIAGEVASGGKDNEHIINRSGVTLDLDHNAPPNILEIIQNALNKLGCYFFAYSTHKSTKEHPRLRIVIPFTHEIDKEKYEAIARYIANLTGIDYFDPVSFVPAQLMYFCSCSCDAEPILYESNIDTFLDPETILAKYVDWKDCTEYPYAESEKAKIKTITNKCISDPLTYKGIRGDFNRAYTITEAIEKFLPDIYKKSKQEGRYDYTKGETTGGLVVFDNKACFSHHSTDPIHGIGCDAYTLVKTHLFGKLDKDSTGKVKPSILKMNELCENDEKVKEVVKSSENVESKISYVCEDWKLKLTRHPITGKYANTLENLIYILSNDKNLLGIRYDIFSNKLSAKDLPWVKFTASWVSQDLDNLKAYLAHNYVQFSDNLIDVALNKVASDRFFHPVNEYLDSLKPWDHVRRIPMLFIKYFNAEDNIYTRETADLIFVAGVARVKEPGVKFDYFPTLCGYQGAFKSTFINKFSNGWFSDSLSMNDIKDKTAAEKLQGNWFVEAPELSGLRKTEIESVKAFASRQDDKYRPSYGKVVEDHPRQCIIWGTTNAEKGFLRDVTGNRRFLVIKFEGESECSPKDITQEEIDNVWAEALYMYNNHHPLVLSEEAEKIAIKVQKEAMETDDREGIVKEYLNRKLPNNWNSKSIDERKTYMYSKNTYDGVEKRQYVSNIEIWCECLQRNVADITRQSSFEISGIMAKFPNWKSIGKAMRMGPYGVQKVYERIKEVDDELEKEELMEGFSPVEEHDELPFA